MLQTTVGFSLINTSFRSIDATSNQRAHSSICFSLIGLSYYDLEGKPLQSLESARKPPSLSIENIPDSIVIKITSGTAQW